MKRTLGILLGLTVAGLSNATEPDSMPRGTVWLVEYNVGPDGMPKDIKILVTADPKMDAKVVAAVAEHWKSPPGWAGKQLRQHFPYIGQWPEGPQHGPSAKYVEVDFSIGPAGVPREIKVKNPEDRTKLPPHTEGSRMIVGDRGAAVDKQDEVAVINVVSKWRFPKDLEGQHWLHGFYFEPENLKKPKTSEPTAPSGRDSPIER
jgi:hypothetical protein